MASIDRARFYVGGPLNGQPVQEIGEYWQHFRDDTGQPLPDEVGDAEMSVEPAAERRYYYWVTMPTSGGITYVHLSLMDAWQGASTWHAAYTAAVGAFEQMR